MTSVRAWIVLLFLAAFGAGFGVGWLASSRTQTAADNGPFEGFRREFVRTFHVSPERSQLLRDLLANYQHEIDALEREQLEAGRPELEKSLAALAVKYRDRIRNNVLPPD